MDTDNTRKIIMRSNIVESLIGAVVLGIAVFVMVFAYNSNQWSGSDDYILTAKFDRIDGLTSGADIRLSGVKVGTVGEFSLDPETFLAVVVLNISPDIKLPKDSSAEIVSDGLMGGKYMALVPGGDDETIPIGGVITHTQASVSLESLIGKFMFSANEKKE